MAFTRLAITSVALSISLSVSVVLYYLEGAYETKAENNAAEGLHAREAASIALRS